MSLVPSWLTSWNLLLPEYLVFHKGNTSSWLLITWEFRKLNQQRGLATEWFCINSFKAKIWTEVWAGQEREAHQKHEKAHKQPNWHSWHMDLNGSITKDMIRAGPEWNGSTIHWIVHKTFAFSIYLSSSFQGSIQMFPLPLSLCEWIHISACLLYKHYSWSDFLFFPVVILFLPFLCDLKCV